MTDTTESVLESSKSWKWVFALGVLLFLGGLLCVGNPLFAGMAVSIIFGWVLLLNGGMYFINSFAASNTGQTFLRLIMGIIYAVAGIWLIAQPGLGLAMLTLILGIALLAEGIVTSIYAFSLPAFVGKGMIILSSILGVIAGIIILVHWPSSSIVVIGLILGLRLLFAGFSFLWLGWAIKKL